MRLLANESVDRSTLSCCVKEQPKSLVGLVNLDDYLYLPQCDDVNGWDLQHGRRVRWGPMQPTRFAHGAFWISRTPWPGDTAGTD